MAHIGWKDQAYVLMMLSVFSGKEPKVLRKRKRPKETSSKAKTSRLVFGDKAEKELFIPAVADGYNYGMGAVDDFDHLTAQNAGLRHIERGGHQAIDHWLLRMVLANCYLLASASDVPLPRQINFRNQKDFRDQWGTDEVTFKDLTDGTNKGKAGGYGKIQFCGEQARRDGLKYFWVDICCIDKSSSAELSEAINSMFRWY
ncbi:hypothetical protein IFR05_012870 [Cadophora sp. M221]|nr:hypothetical protein IFR05_012870 [Cadophora sp. M221]